MTDDSFLLLDSLKPEVEASYRLASMDRARLVFGIVIR